MSELAQLIEAIDRLSPRIPVIVDLWSVREIAAYLKRSESVVRERIAVLPGFPQAIRLPAPSGKTGRGNPLWKAREVIAWTEKYQEHRVDRRILDVPAPVAASIPGWSPVGMGAPHEENPSAD